MKSFTPACLWFIICANYFPLMTNQKKEETFQEVLKQLHEKEFPLLSRINKQTLKLGKTESDESSKICLMLTNKMISKCEEIIHLHGITDLSNTEELYSNTKYFPYKTAYTKDDDNFINDIRKYGLEKFEEFFNEDEYQNVTYYQKAIAFKKLPLDYLIELLSIDKMELKNSNLKQLNQIKENFFSEDANRLLKEKENFEGDDLLKDLEFFTSIESEFLNYLETKQQQALALVNMDIYDDPKPTNILSNTNNNETIFSDLSKKEIALNASNNETNNNNNTKSLENLNILCENSEVLENGEKNDCSNIILHIKTSQSANTTNVSTHSKNHKVLLKDDIVCQVCNDGDYSEDNMIVFCSVYFFYYYVFHLM